MGHFGFSYVGLIFLAMLFIPNIIWSKNQPQGYDPGSENKILLAFERIGEVLTTVLLLIFNDINFHGWSAWCLWLIAAFALMVMYELWWVKYFRSERRLSDFYSGFMGIPLAGATLPVAALFLFGHIRQSRLDIGGGRYFRNRAYRNTYSAQQEYKQVI